MSTQHKYYCVFFALIFIGTVALWPIFWAIDKIAGTWMFMPAILTMGVFYWILIAGVWAAKESGDKAAKSQGVQS